MNLYLWNATAITKQLWDLADKNDCLWIKWVHIYYIKNNSIESYASPKNSTLVIRKIIDSIQQIMRAHGLQEDLQTRLASCVKGSKFLIKKLYDALSPQYPKFPWKGIMLSPCIHPRHKFTLWIALHHRIPIVERLARIGIQIPVECVFYRNADETHDHLFMKCNVIRRL